MCYTFSFQQILRIVCIPEKFHNELKVVFQNKWIVKISITRIARCTLCYKQKLILEEHKERIK